MIFHIENSVMMDHLKRVHSAGQNGTEVREMSEGMKRWIKMKEIEIDY